MGLNRLDYSCNLKTYYKYVPTADMECISGRTYYMTYEYISNDNFVWFPTGNKSPYKIAPIDLCTPNYRWVQLPISDYICVGYDKHYKEKKQVSYDSGSTWSDVSPLETRAGTLYEANSEDCGYVPPTPTGATFTLVPIEQDIWLYPSSGSISVSFTSAKDGEPYYPTSGLILSNIGILVTSATIDYTNHRIDMVYNANNTSGLRSTTIYLLQKDEGGTTRNTSLFNIKQVHLSENKRIEISRIYKDGDEWRIGLATLGTSMFSCILEVQMMINNNSYRATCILDAEGSANPTFSFPCSEDDTSNISVTDMRIINGILDTQLNDIWYYDYIIESEERMVRITLDRTAIYH